MTDCGCEKAKTELEEYLHRELSDEDFRDVSDHLENCEDCNGEHLVGLTLLQKLQSSCKEKAPDDLRRAILDRLDGVATH